MINYVLEDSNNSSNIFLVDDEFKIKILVAVVFDKAHSRIILRKMNEYVRDSLDGQRLTNAKESIANM